MRFCYAAHAPCSLFLLPPSALPLRIPCGRPSLLPWPLSLLCIPSASLFSKRRFSSGFMLTTAPFHQTTSNAPDQRDGVKALDKHDRVQASYKNEKASARVPASSLIPAPSPPTSKQQETRPSRHYIPRQETRAIYFSDLSYLSYLLGGEPVERGRSAFHLCSHEKTPSVSLSL